MSRNIIAGLYPDINVGLYYHEGRIIAADVPPPGAIPFLALPTAGELYSALADPPTPTVVPHNIAGTTAYSYYIVARDSLGNQTNVSSAGSTSTGNATLDYENYNLISWYPVAGAASYDVLKGNTSTLLGSTSNNYYADTGQSTSAYTAPTRNATGDQTVAGTWKGQSTATLVNVFATLYLMQVANGVGFRFTLNNDGHLYLQRSTDGFATEADEAISYGPDGLKLMPWSGSVAIGGSIATTATDGYLYIPTCAGTPTGTPTAQTGTVPLVYDTTGKHLWIYNGTAWESH